MREIPHRADPVQQQGRGPRQSGLEHLRMPDYRVERRIAVSTAPRAWGACIIAASAFMWT